MNLVARIRNVIEESELSSAAFADKIGVQRSSISHILSGRNKPSLDFILKVLDAFPTLDSDWLLLGKDSSQTPNAPIPSSLFPEEVPKESAQKEIVQPSSLQHEEIQEAHTSSDKEVERVTVFYTDGTCSTYTNKK
ncbi:MAG: helix-turn-helix domain-containing protein [Flavobacteriaceae bacterium]